MGFAAVFCRRQNVSRETFVLSVRTPGAKTAALRPRLAHPHVSPRSTSASPCVRTPPRSASASSCGCLLPRDALSLYAPCGCFSPCGSGRSALFGLPSRWLRIALCLLGWPEACFARFALPRGLRSPSFPCAQNVSRETFVLAFDALVCSVLCLRGVSLRAHAPPALRPRAPRPPRL